MFIKDDVKDKKITQVLDDGECVSVDVVLTDKEKQEKADLWNANALSKAAQIAAKATEPTISSLQDQILALTNEIEKLKVK